MRSKQTFSLIVLVCLALGLRAQVVKMEKAYDQSFAYQEGDKVLIENKYGEVIVNSWYKDSVRVKVQLEASGKNQDAVNKVMRRIDIDLRKIGERITAETQVEVRGGGVLGEIARDVGNYSKSLFSSNNKFTANYEVWLPTDAEISIENRYGDIYLSTLEGEVSIDLAHGDLRADRIEQTIDLDHSFGKASFDFVKVGTLNLRGVELSIEEATTLQFESSSSEIELETCEDIQFNSRNDNFDIRKAQNVMGKGSFTDITVGELKDRGRLDFRYGDVLLNYVNKEFKELTVNGKSTDISVVLDQASYLKTRVTGKEEGLLVPNSMLTLNREVLENDMVQLEGMVGNTNEVVSELTIIADGGELIVAIQDTPIFTSKD
ncbi:MAG: hypothetical protein AAGA85_04255 [Bacteroidota bacterium]